MKNLRNLKDQKEYQGISVKDDYTVAEREIIKEFVQEAKKRSAAESEDSQFIWKVFGTPKDDTLLIRRIPKKSPIIV